MNQRLNALDLGADDRVRAEQFVALSNHHWVGGLKSGARNCIAFGPFVGPLANHYPRTVASQDAITANPAEPVWLGHERCRG